MSNSVSTVGELKNVLEDYSDDTPVIFVDHPDGLSRSPSLVSTINDHDGIVAAKEFSFQPGRDHPKPYVVFSTFVVGDTRQFTFGGEPIAVWPGRRS